MQRLLMSEDWDADMVRDDLRDYVVEHLAPRVGDPAGVLVGWVAGTNTQPPPLAIGPQRRSSTEITKRSG